MKTMFDDDRILGLIVLATLALAVAFFLTS